MCVLISTLSMHRALVVLDEAHAAHVGRQLKDRADPLEPPGSNSPCPADPESRFSTLGDDLVPLVQGLDVHGADLARAARNQILDQMTANKTSRSANRQYSDP